MRGLDYTGQLLYNRRYNMRRSPSTQCRSLSTDIASAADYRYRCNHSSISLGSWGLDYTVQLLYNRTHTLDHSSSTQCRSQSTGTTSAAGFHYKYRYLNNLDHTKDLNYTALQNNHMYKPGTA